MDLWIRSQDKKRLLKANNLWIMNNEIWLEVPFYEHHKKIGLSVAGHNHKIATYKTKKRALEVLDEIQDVLMPKIKVLQSVNAENNIDDLVSRPTIQECGKVELLQYSDYVYQMPKE